MQNKPIQVYEITPESFAAMVADSVEKALEKRLESFSKPPIQGRNYTRKEAAEFLKLSKVTLWKRTREGAIPSYRHGSRVLYRESDLTTYILSNRTR